MSIRTALSFVLALGLFVVPPAAKAGGGKGPIFLTVDASGELISFSPARAVVVAPEVDLPGLPRTKGKYVIGFDRNVSDCAATATTGAGWVGVVGVAVGSPSAAFITVFVVDSASQQLVNLPFHLIVMCPK